MCDSFISGDHLDEQLAPLSRPLLSRPGPVAAFEAFKKAFRCFKLDTTARSAAVVAGLSLAARPTRNSPLWRHNSRPW